MTSPFLKIENRIRVCEEFKNSWASFFRCFEDDLRRKAITQNDEIAFEQIFTLLALNYWEFAELMDKDFSDSGRIIKVLNSTVSLQVLKEMSEAQFSKTELDWHTIFIDLNKTYGRLLSMRPLTREEIKEQKRIEEEKAKATKAAEADIST